MKILAISGSLREASTNTSILKNVKQLAPENVEFQIYYQAGELLHFSPDIDLPEAPENVKTLRNLVGAADGVLFCTPEYAFGMPGSFKNALDWLVSSGELNEKPVAAISASPMYTGGDKALAALLLTLTALGSQLTGTLSIPAISTKIDQEKFITDAPTIASLKGVLQALISAIEVKQISTPSIE